MAKQTSILSYFRSAGTWPEAVVVIDPDTSADDDWHKGIPDFEDFYRVDLDPMALQREFELFRLHKEFQECKNIPEIIKMLKESRLVSAYRNVATLYKICCTIPVTSASCERSFSKLKLVKTALRSTMSQDRLSSLVVIGTETDLSDNSDRINIDNVIDAFASRSVRRMVL